MHLSVKDLLDRFNIGNAVLYVLLLVLSVLVSLRVEGIITVSYGVVFLPLWLWNLLVFVGAVSGVIVWILKKRQDEEHHYHIKALILTPFLHFPVFLTELLIVINLDTGDHLWRAIFSPLYLLPIIYTLPCIWGCCRKRNIELELLGVSSLLQVIFLGVRLDNLVLWKWAFVFIPTYLFLIGVLGCLLSYTSYLIYHNVSTILTPQDLQARMADIIYLSCSFFIWLCSTLFLGLLVAKLDGQLTSSFPAIFIPLFLVFLLLMLTTVSRRPANPWWFGTHKHFSTLLLDHCPFVKSYANVSVVPEDQHFPTLPSSFNNSTTIKTKTKLKLEEEEEEHQFLYEHYPLEDIYTPD